MKRIVRAVVILFAEVVASGHDRVAPPDPGTDSSEICNLSVQALDDHGLVLLTWSGGTPPFVVMRSDRGSFSEGADLTLVESRVSTRQFVIPERPGLRYHYWYQVFDRNSVPEAFSVKPATFKKEQRVSVRGIGFSKDCAQNRVLVAGIVAGEIRGCSENGLKFRAPADSNASTVSFVGPNGNGSVGDQQRCKGALQHPLTWQ
jgi:hypothetical protein